MTVCSLNSQISPASKNRALIHHETVKSLRYGQSLISSLSHGYCDVFFGGNFLKVYGSGQSDVRSETSMTTCCVLNANMDSGEPSSQNCMTKYGSSYTQIVYWLRVSGVWNYPIGLAYLRCSRSPRNRLHKQRAAKPYKMAMNWAQVTQKKTTTDPSSRKYNLVLYSCLYFYVLTTILNFSCKVFKSFLICKTISKLVVIYSPSLGACERPCDFLPNRTLSCI